MSEPASSNPQPDPPPTVARRPFQFRLRTLFFLTTLAAVLLAGLTWPSSAVRVLTTDVLVLVVAVFLSLMAVYARGYFRVFCIGALPPVVIQCVINGPIALGLCHDALYDFDVAAFDEARQPVAWFHLLLGLIMGLMAVGFHWAVGLDATGHLKPVGPTASPRSRSWRDAMRIRLRVLVFVGILSPLVVAGLTSRSSALVSLTSNLVSLLLGIAFLVGLAYGRGHLRVFCLGAMLPQAGRVFFSSVGDSIAGLFVDRVGSFFWIRDEWAGPVLACEVATAMAAGLVAITVHWALESSRQDLSE